MWVYGDFYVGFCLVSCWVLCVFCAVPIWVFMGSMWGFTSVLCGCYVCFYLGFILGFMCALFWGFILGFY